MRTIAIYRVQDNGESFTVENLLTGEAWECDNGAGQSVGDVIDWDWVSDEQRAILAADSDATDALLDADNWTPHAAPQT